MLTIKEPGNNIPVVDEVDICVIGGSCTGVFAAVRAARLGARVAIVEQQGCFGGVATNGLVNIWHSAHDTVGKQKIIAGLTNEVVERLKKRKAVRITSHLINTHVLNTEELKIELDELITEAGVKPYLHTFYAAPHQSDGKLNAVFVENKDGRQAIKAKVFIDASGDGDLGMDIGLSSYDPGSFQPPTLCAKIFGINCFGTAGDFASSGGFDWVSAVRDHGKEFGLASDWGWRSPVPGLPGISMHAETHVFDMDISHGSDLTKAEIEGRRQVRALMDVIRKYGPTDNPIALVDLASYIGAREGNRIEAEYRLTGDDVLMGVRFDDAIANGSYRVDIHHHDGPGITFRYLDGTEVVIPGHGKEKQVKKWRGPVEKDPTFYQIPLRSLIPKGTDNLMIAGRILDADKDAMSAARVMVNMNQTGEAAGITAFHAVDKNCPVTSVDASQVRKTLSAGGSIIL